MAAGFHNETLRLEGFAENLKGRKVFCASNHPPKFLQTFLKGKVAALDAEVVHRGRKVLVVQGVQQAPKWLAQMSWDATFHIRDVQDLKLALTYIQHATKPTRVFWVGGEPAAAAIQALYRIEGLTLVAVGDRGAPQHSEWDAVFWGPDATFEDVDGFVTGRMGAHRTTNLRLVLKELHASNVGLVWSSIGESDKRGDLYWYDPTEGYDGVHHVDPVEAAETLRAVADLLTK